MNPLMTRLTAACVCIVVWSQPACAWGPKARQAVTMAALQILRLTHDTAFTATESNYEVDLFRGAKEGISVIRDSVPLHTPDQAVAAVAHEIQLLRATREDGAGSYFAYRMGVLSALVAQVMAPYGLAYSEEEGAIKAKIDTDVDAHVERFLAEPRRSGFVFLRSVNEYFDENRLFFESDYKLIKDDYGSTRGYGGFLSAGAEAYFTRSARAVADAWYTVFSHHALPSDETFSPRVHSWYLVHQLGYLLSIKKNIVHADMTYEKFKKIDPNISEALEVIGDHYYAFGTPSSKERGVKEWKLAHRHPGPQRTRVAKKVADHYLDMGKMLFAKSQGPESESKDLEEALRSFRSALEFERNNDFAADHITETTMAISARQEKFDTAQSIIDKALTVIQQAERAHLGESYQAALSTYNQALMLLDVVDTEFDDLYAKARKDSGRVKQSIRDVIEDVFAKANDLIEEGDAAVDNFQFDQGINHYNNVEEQLSVVPTDENSDNLERKNKLVNLAAVRVDDARVKKERRDRERKQAAQAAAANN